MVGTQLDLDTIVDLCRDKHRRIVLAALTDRQRSVSLDDLAKTIAEHNDTPAMEASDEAITRIKKPLYHFHVPKLADAGLVDFDADEELVEPREGFDRIEPHLTSFVEVEADLSESI